jgi:hypothetical protein
MREGGCRKPEQQSQGKQRIMPKFCRHGSREFKRIPQKYSRRAALTFHCCHHFFSFLVVLEFEPRALYLLDRSSTTLALPSALFFLLVLELNSGPHACKANTLPRSYLLPLALLPLA